MDAVEQIRRQVLDVTVQRLDRSRPAGRQREHRRGRGARDGARRARDLPQGERKVDGVAAGSRSLGGRLQPPSSSLAEPVGAGVLDHEAGRARERLDQASSAS